MLEVTSSFASDDFSRALPVEGSLRKNAPIAAGRRIG
jgi:hypothetical protein